jgi:hypothetical protein
LIALPQIKQVDDYFRLCIDEVEAQSANIEHVPFVLKNYKELHLPKSSTSIQYARSTFAEKVIPCILAVDAMAIEPYSEKSKRLLLLNHAGVNERVSHIRCTTAPHGRGCAAYLRREKGKPTLRRLAVVKTR